MKSLFHPSLKDVALELVLYALSDRVRLSIVQQLQDKGELTCGEFCAAANKGKSTMTHHFKVLRDSGIIHTRVEGREHFTTLRHKELDTRFPGLLDVILLASKSNKKKSV